MAVGAVRGFFPSGQAAIWAVDEALVPVFLGFVRIGFQYDKSARQGNPETCAEVKQCISGQDVRWWLARRGEVVRPSKGETGFPAGRLLVFWLVHSFFSTKTQHNMAWWRAVICTVISHLFSFVLNAVYPHGLVLGFLEACESDGARQRQPVSVILRSTILHAA